MKYLSMFLLTIALLVSVACQPMLRQDAAAEELDPQNRKDNASAVPVAPLYDRFPARFRCDAFTEAQNVHVTADVPLRVLCDGNAFPTLRVRRRSLSIAERYALARRLLGVEPLYIWHPNEPVQGEIAAEQPAFAVWDGTTTPNDPDEVAGIYLVTEPYNASRICASDPCNMSYAYFDTAEPYQGIVYVRAPSHTVIETVSTESNLGARLLLPEEYDRPQNGASITAQQAIEQTLAIAEGFGDFTVSEVLWKNDADRDGDGAGLVYHWGYEVRLSQRFGDAYSPYCEYISNCIQADSIVQWPHESVSAWIDRDGTLLSFTWCDALSVTETIVPETPLLPLDEIVSLFLQQMDRSHAGNLCKNAVLVVDGVQLGLFRVRESGSTEQGLLVPAWFFTGSFSFSDAVRADNPFLATELHGSSSPLCIINAADGSIIDP